MNIAIIGSGNVGTALATSLTRVGHAVTLSASHPEHAQLAATQAGAQAAKDNASAASGAEVIILAVPFSAGQDIAREIASGVAGKVVIDATNPLKPDLSGVTTEGTSGAEEFQRWLPGAHVVKAFNTIFASRQAQPSRDLDAFVAADDDGARQQVMSLVESMGFTPLDVGSLSVARSLEGMALLNIRLNATLGWAWTSAWKLER